MNLLLMLFHLNYNGRIELKCLWVSMEFSKLDFVCFTCVLILDIILAKCSVHNRQCSKNAMDRAKLKPYTHEDSMKLLVVRWSYNWFSVNEMRKNMFEWQFAEWWEFEFIINVIDRLWKCDFLRYFKCMTQFHHICTHNVSVSLNWVRRNEVPVIENVNAACRWLLKHLCLTTFKCRIRIGLQNLRNLGADTSQMINW